jgi:hypothetical protein
VKTTPPKVGMGWPENPGHPPAMLQVMCAAWRPWAARRRELPVPPVRPIPESGNSSSGRCRRNHVRENAHLPPVHNDAPGASVLRVTPPGGIAPLHFLGMNQYF